MKNMIHSENPCKEPFPRTCSDCGKEEVRLATITYEAKIKHDSRLHTFQVPQLLVNKCDSCGEVFFDAVTSDQIYQALRNYLELLSPQEIRQRISALGLNQQEFAKQLRIAPETVSRWLSGAYIQSCSSDKSMRMFFELEEKKRSISQSGEVSLQYGEMPSWNYPTPYQIEVINKLDTIAPNIPVLSGMDAGIPLEMTRGPPACETMLIIHI